jgi:phenylacetate-CoA ligase
MELLPGAPTGTRTVITALDFRTMPILRYDLGDDTAPIEGACPCGLSFPRIQAPKGRISGLIRLPHGRAIASWSLRSNIRELPGVDQYRLVQEGPTHLVVHVVLEKSAPDPAVEVERRLRPLVGAAVRLDIVRATSLPAGPQRTDLIWRS